MTSSSDVLRLYEKWLRTGSTRDGQKLIDRGILPRTGELQIGASRFSTSVSRSFPVHTVSENRRQGVWRLKNHQRRRVPRTGAMGL